MAALNCFSLHVRRDLLGLVGTDPVWLASTVVPMGWISSTGVIQHIHRRLLLVPKSIAPSLRCEE